MSAGSDYVERLALAWAAADPIQRWVIGGEWEDLTASDRRDLIDDYLGRANPFPDEMDVVTRGIDDDGHEEHAVIVERVDRNEWVVRFDDDAEAWRGHTELRPLAVAGGK